LDGSLMPRPGPRRPIVCVRLSDQQIAAIDQLADEAGVNRSEIIRSAVDLLVEETDAGRWTLAPTRKQAP
jgi:Arc/MetJ-type ribon-helix-helix transcriptional regulator